jgi:hypothetical protein
MIILITFLLFNKKVLLLILTLVSIDSFLKIQSDLNFKQKESHAIYNFVQLYHNQLYKTSIIILDSTQFKNIPKYKFKLLENASKFLYVNNRLSYEFKFIFTDKQNEKEPYFIHTLNNYFKTIK